MENKPTGIIWHHTGDPATGHQADVVNASHRTRSFPLSSLGFYGGYHILVEKDGTLFRFRNDNEIGAHTFDHNQDTLGICMAGNFDVERPTLEQLNAFAKQIFEWQEKYIIGTDYIRPHRHFRATDCPGKLLEDNLAWDLVDKLAQDAHTAAEQTQ